MNPTSSLPRGGSFSNCCVVAASFSGVSIHAFAASLAETHLTTTHAHAHPAMQHTIVSAGGLPTQPSIAHKAPVAHRALRNVPTSCSGQKRQRHLASAIVASKHLCEPTTTSRLEREMDIQGVRDTHLQSACLGGHISPSPPSVPTPRSQCCSPGATSNP